MPQCCIQNCGNYTGHKHGTKNIKYFAFPKNAKLRDKWLQTCLPKTTKKISDTSRICEQHFKDECFEMKLSTDKSKLIKRLIVDCVPTENLDLPTKIVRKKDKTVIGSTHLVSSYEELLKYSKEKNYSGKAETPVSLKETGNLQAENKAANTDLTKYLQVPESNIAKILQENANLRKEIAQLKSQLSAQKRANISERDRTIKLLNRYFTPGQVKYLLQENNTRLRWTAEDISSAISLHAISPKAYKFLKNVWKYPLPCESTLRIWCRNFSAKPGVLHDVLQIMKSEAQNFNPEDKIVVLCFDEIDVSNKLDIDFTRLKIADSHRSCQVVMARGLFSSWTQPVYNQFDQRMTKLILFDILQSLYNIGYTVVAITSGMHSSNIELWKEVGVYVKLNDTSSKSDCFFFHPSNKESKVFVFADVPHLIKLARNHLLDTGFRIGTDFIDKSQLQELVNLNNSDCKIAFKLSRTHLEVQGSQRQKIELATQVFSYLNSKAFEYFGEYGIIKAKQWKLTSHVLRIFNDWFDIFNIQNKDEKCGSAQAYGLYLEEQRQLLDSMTKFMFSMKVGNEKSLVPFQNGIILTNESLKGLFDFLKEKFSGTEFNFEYLVTKRLNQDILENYFCLHESHENDE